MLRVFRSPRLACLTLAAFLVAQPVVVCSYVCLADNHHVHHDAAGTAGSAVTGTAACHSDIGAATQHVPAQTLSVMEPAAAPAPPRFATRSVEPPDARQAVAPQVAPRLEPPPPRLV